MRPWNRFSGPYPISINCCSPNFVENADRHIWIILSPFWRASKPLKTLFDLLNRFGSFSKDNSWAVTGNFRLRTGRFYENLTVFVNINIQTRGRKQQKQRQDCGLMGPSLRHPQCQPGAPEFTFTSASGSVIIGKALNLAGPGVFVFNYTDGWEPDDNT